MILDILKEYLEDQRRENSPSADQDKTVEPIKEQHNPLTVKRKKENSIDIPKSQLDEVIRLHPGFRSFIKNLDFASPNYFLDLGSNQVEMSSAISTKILNHSKGLDSSIYPYLDEIAQIVTNINHKKIMKKGFVPRFLGMFDINIPSTVMKDSIKDINFNKSKIQEILRGYKTHITKLENLGEEIDFVYKKLDEVKSFCEFLISYINKIDKENFNRLELENIELTLSILEKRLTFIIETKINVEMARGNLFIMKETYSSQYDACNNTIYTLVESWKVQCSTIISIMDSDNKQGFKSEVDSLLVTRDNLLNEIGKIIKQ